MILSKAPSSFLQIIDFHVCYYPPAKKKKNKKHPILFFLDKIKKEQDRLFAKASVSSGKCNCAIFFKGAQFAIWRCTNQNFCKENKKHSIFASEGPLFIF